MACKVSLSPYLCRLKRSNSHLQCHQLTVMGFLKWIIKKSQIIYYKIITCERLQLLSFQSVIILYDIWEENRYIYFCKTHNDIKHVDKCHCTMFMMGIGMTIGWWVKQWTDRTCLLTFYTNDWIYVTLGRKVSAVFIFPMAQMVRRSQSMITAKFTFHDAATWHLGCLLFF